MRSETPPPDGPDEDRRRFLTLCAGAVGVCASGAIAAPVIGQLLAPVGLRTVHGSDALLDLGGVDEFTIDRPRKVVVRGPASDAWSASEEELGPVFIVRHSDGTFGALSAICPHLGCAVDFEEVKARYCCPCHDSYFGADGGVEAGPSPRGLDPLDVKVENGRVRLQFKRYRLGGAERIEA